MTGDGQTKRCPCGCRTAIDAVRLVCAEGWGRLPESLREAVRATGQARRLSPSPETVADSRAAVADARSWWALNPEQRQALETADVTPRAIRTTDQCDACLAPVLWCVTAKGVRVPVDPEPVRAATGAADCVVTERPNRPPRVHVLRSQAELFGRRWAHRTHLRTCPHAERYRALARRRRSAS